MLVVNRTYLGHSSWIGRFEYAFEVWRRRHGLDNSLPVHFVGVHITYGTRVGVYREGFALETAVGYVSAGFIDNNK